MSDVVDARGLSCPQPVLMTLNRIKKADVRGLLVLVDTEASKENVIRAAGSQGWCVDKVESEGGGYRLTVSRDQSLVEPVR